MIPTIRRVTTTVARIGFGNTTANAADCFDRAHKNCPLRLAVEMRSGHIKESHHFAIQLFLAPLARHVHTHQHTQTFNRKCSSKRGCNVVGCHARPVSCSTALLRIMRFWSPSFVSSHILGWVYTPQQGTPPSNFQCTHSSCACSRPQLLASLTSRGFSKAPLISSKYSLAWLFHCGPSTVKTVQVSCFLQLSIQILQNSIHQRLRTSAGLGTFFVNLAAISSLLVKKPVGFLADLTFTCKSNLHWSALTVITRALLLRCVTKLKPHESALQECSCRNKRPWRN